MEGFSRVLHLDLYTRWQERLTVGQIPVDGPRTKQTSEIKQINRFNKQISNKQRARSARGTVTSLRVDGVRVDIVESTTRRMFVCPQCGKHTWHIYFCGVACAECSGLKHHQRVTRPQYHPKSGKRRRILRVA